VFFFKHYSILTPYTGTVRLFTSSPVSFKCDVFCLLTFLFLFFNPVIIIFHFFLFIYLCPLFQPLLVFFKYALFSNFFFLPFYPFICIPFIVFNSFFKFLLTMFFRLSNSFVFFLDCFFFFLNYSFIFSSSSLTLQPTTTFPLTPPFPSQH
jgi:hypothetical protein